jgi:hypothetical protein
MRRNLRPAVFGIGPGFRWGAARQTSVSRTGLSCTSQLCILPSIQGRADSLSAPAPLPLTLIGRTALAGLHLHGRYAGAIVGNVFHEWPRAWYGGARAPPSTFSYSQRFFLLIIQRLIYRPDRYGYLACPDRTQWIPAAFLASLATGPPAAPSSCCLWPWPGAGPQLDLAGGPHWAASLAVLARLAFGLAPNSWYGGALLSLKSATWLRL